MFYVAGWLSSSGLILSMGHYTRPILGYSIEILRYMYVIGERAKRARHSQVCSIKNHGYKYVIVINHMRGLYGIYKSRDTRAKPEWQGFMNRVQTERWFITIL